VAIGFHVPAKALSSFVKAAPSGAPETLGEPRPANSKKVNKRIGAFRVIARLDPMLPLVRKGGHIGPPLQNPAFLE